MNCLGPVNFKPSKLRQEEIVPYLVAVAYISDFLKKPVGEPLPRNKSFLSMFALAMGCDLPKRIDWNVVQKDFAEFLTRLDAFKSAIESSDAERIRALIRPQEENRDEEKAEAP